MNAQFEIQDIEIVIEIVEKDKNNCLVSILDVDES
ncbi:unnamed protein product [Paramecium sonneborni]|uniref:Uncharacterized protein n=1 Tax=Paramecium sonneborni TaxID=65129 RepID=A0A8S1R3S0_9CILI|nr:unnamed protein product [Paramecium sonneborni]